MPVILPPGDYARWLGEEPDRGLMRPFPAEPMWMWPISARVNRPENEPGFFIQSTASTACLLLFIGAGAGVVMQLLGS